MEQEFYNQKRQCLPEVVYQKQESQRSAWESIRKATSSFLTAQMQTGRPESKYGNTIRDYLQILL